MILVLFFKFHIFIHFISFSRIVEKPEDYLYGSARNYLGMKGLVDVIFLDVLLW